MFIQQVGSNYPGREAGLVLVKHLPTKSYFLNNVRHLRDYILRLQNYVIYGGNNTKVFQEFRKLVVKGVLEHWEFHYSHDPKEPLPRDILRQWKYVCSNTVSDAVIKKQTDSTVYCVRCDDVDFPIYVVSRIGASKNTVIKRAIRHLQNYFRGGPQSWYYNYVTEQPGLFLDALSSLESALNNLNGKTLKNTQYEQVQFDNRTFTIPTSQATSLNKVALGLVACRPSLPTN